jgi:hypothetical protein
MFGKSTPMKELRYILAERTYSRHSDGSVASSVRNENEPLARVELAYLHYWLRIPIGYGYPSPISDTTHRNRKDFIDIDPYRTPIPPSLNFNDDPIHDNILRYWGCTGY